MKTSTMRVPLNGQNNFSGALMTVKLVKLAYGSQGAEDDSAHAALSIT